MESFKCESPCTACIEAGKGRDAPKTLLNGAWTSLMISGYPLVAVINLVSRKRVVNQRIGNGIGWEAGRGGLEAINVNWYHSPSTELHWSGKKFLSKTYSFQNTKNVGGRQQWNYHSGNLPFGNINENGKVWGKKKERGGMYLRRRAINFICFLISHMNAKLGYPASWVPASML